MLLVLDRGLSPHYGYVENLPTPVGRNSRSVLMGWMDEALVESGGDVG